MSDAPFIKALVDLQLSPQEQDLYWHHLGNLYGDGKVMQPNGDISTVLQAVVGGPDGRYYNIPTVWEGKVLSPEEAKQKAIQTGLQRFPAYDSPEQADARYSDMHKYMEQDTTRYDYTRRK